MNISIFPQFIFQFFKTLYRLMQIHFLSNFEKDFIILALESQIQLIKCQGTVKPKFNPFYRTLWVALSKFLKNWKSYTYIMKPETVMKWHKSCFKIYWRAKSKNKKVGRPRISPEVISFIKKIHAQNPTMSPEKIYEKLKNLNIENVPAPNTIAKYIQKLPHTPTGGQSWKTFIRNHQSLWAMDFFVVPTIGLKLLYVLVIINHHRRKIEYCSVTKHPTSAWLEQQIREATPWNNTPKYLLHDNGPMFISHRFQAFLKNSNIKSIRTTPHSPWQNGICERVVKTIKMELVHHIIPLNEKHLHHMLKEYIDKYYNPQRTHQAIDCETPIKSKPFPPTSISDTVLKATPILNGLYHEYSKMVS